MKTSSVTAAALLALAGLMADTNGASAQFTFPGFYPTYHRPAPHRAQVRRTEPRKHVRPPAKHRAPHREKAPHREQAQRDLTDVAQRQGFKPVSDLVHFPTFFPGLGIIYVKPDTLPLGPFECFDRNKRLVATVYMVPIKDIDDHKTLEAKAPGFAGKIDHTTLYFNAGHPGVEMPHYHVVLWHVTKDQERRVAQ